MATSWRGAVSEQAELISSRLGQLVSSSLRFLHDELGIELGIEPEVYPVCGIVCVALVVGVLALLVWLAACGRGRKRKHGATTSQSSVRLNVNATDSTKIEEVKPVKTDEPKKKNRKKAADKQKTQSNGGTIPEPRQDVKIAQEPPKKQPQQTAPAQTPQPPADIKTEKAKKSKKKTKPEVKQPQSSSATDGKEPDEGAWETKISNREKRQQRRKEKGPGDESGSPGGVGVVSQQAEQPSVPSPISTKKNKSNKDSSSKPAKRDAIVTPAPANWNPVNSVNAGGWTNMSTKVSPQVSAPDSKAWHGDMKTSRPRNAEPLAWGQESETESWTRMDGRIKKELNPVNFHMLQSNPPAGEPVSSSSADLRKWDGSAPADEWAGYNGLGAGDPSSDWNAPSEVWGNYEEPKAETPAAQEKPVVQPARLQESDDDKEKGDSFGNGKSKRRKKKKKKPEDENAVSQTNMETVTLPSQGEGKGNTTKGSPAPALSGVVKPRPHLSVEEPTKQNNNPPSNQKKSDQMQDPQKQVQKKKARRET